MKNSYETLFIVKPTLTEEETGAILQKYKDEVAAQGGELKAERIVGLRRLAYPIQKQERGFYTILYYVAPPSAIAEIERKMKYDEDVLRFMTVKYTNKKELAQFEKQVTQASSSSKSTKSEESAEA